MEAKKDPRGRKPSADPKIGVRTYIYRSSIEKLGGLEAVQVIIHSTIDRRLKKKK